MDDTAQARRAAAIRTLFRWSDLAAFCASTRLKREGLKLKAMGLILHDRLLRGEGR